MPKDVQLQKIDVVALPEPGQRDPAPTFSDADIARAAAMINAAARPVLYVGGGAIQSGAGPLVTRLAEKAGIPTAMTLMGLGAVPSDHPLALGMLGMHAARSTNLILEESDLLIALGVRFDDRATGKVAEFCPNARVLHIDIDASELGKIRRPELGFAADVTGALTALLPRIEQNQRADWGKRVHALRSAYPLRMPGADDPRTPYGLIREVARHAGMHALVTTDVGQHQMWAAQAWPFQGGRTWFTSGGLGTMGFGLPAAIGASLARPDVPVVCISGDGSLLMNIQELAVAAEENVNVKIILMNNNSLGLVHQQQDLFYEKRLYASDFKAGPDFLRIAAGFGIRGIDLAEATDPSAAIAGAFATPGPCLIHAPIDVNEKVYPMVPPGAANHTMLERNPHETIHA